MILLAAHVPPPFFAFLFFLGVLHRFCLSSLFDPSSPFLQSTHQNLEAIFTSHSHSHEDLKLDPLRSPSFLCFRCRSAAGVSNRYPSITVSGLPLSWKTDALCPEPRGPICTVACCHRFTVEAAQSSTLAPSFPFFLPSKAPPFPFFFFVG